MDVLLSRVTAGLSVAMFLALLSFAGCQSSPLLAERLLHQQQSVDPSGLADVRHVSSVLVSCAPPLGWYELPAKRTSLYTHQQWRSPTRMTGVGALHVNLPLPLPTGTLIWMAKREFYKKETEGRIIAEWNDSIGRNWFEGENKTYHVKGYVVVDGFNAWVVYSGYKLSGPPSEPELALARRCMQTIVPEIHGPIEAEAQASAAPSEQGI